MLRRGLLAIGCLALATAAQGGAHGPTWPVGSDCAVFVFQDAFETVLAFDRPGAEPIFNYALEYHGLAHLDGAGALLLGHGTASAPRQDAALLELFSNAPGLSVQVWLTPPTPDKERTVFAYGPPREGDTESASAPNFELAQRGNTYIFRMRIGGRIERVIARSTSGTPQHVTLTYDGGRLALYVDGREVGASEGLAGGFESWKTGPLLFGSGTPAKRGWDGALEGIAIHSRALSSEEVLDSANLYAQRVAERNAPPVTRLLGKLVACSTVPTPEDIAPYPEALAVFEYDVVRVLEGFYLAKKMRVAHWVVLGETSLATGRLSIGDEVELTAIDFTRNPQLENVSISDTLPFDFDLRLFFDVTSPLAVAGK